MLGPTRSTPRVLPVPGFLAEMFIQMCLACLVGEGREAQISACSVGRWLMAGAGLFWKKSTAGWLQVADSFGEFLCPALSHTLLSNLRFSLRARFLRRDEIHYSRKEPPSSAATRSPEGQFFTDRSSPATRSPAVGKGAAADHCAQPATSAGRFVGVHGLEE
jgi:hypothetical protein